MRAGRHLLIAAATTLALAAAVVVAARIPRVREAVREPITMTVVALLVRPWQARAAWTAGAPPPTAVLEPAAAVVGGRLYVFGGFVIGAGPHPFPASTRVQVYDPGAGAWTRAADLPEAVTHANTVVVDGEVWSAGGFVGDDPGRAVATVRRYDPAADRWRAGPPLPEPVAGGTLALLGRTLHYVGGFAPDRDTVVATHWALALDGLGAGGEASGAERAPGGEARGAGAAPRWEARAPLRVARGHLASAVVGGRLFAIGGQVRHDTDPVDLAVVEAYDPAADAWTDAASLPAPRSHFEAATFVDGGRIVVVGGRNDTASLFIKGAGLADVLVYDPAADRWTERPGLPVGIESAVARPVGGRLVVTAGATFGDVVPQRRTFLGAPP